MIVILILGRWCHMQANDGNVEIISENGDASGQGTFAVKLLSSERRALSL
jgi:hypothetical protein